MPRVKERSVLLWTPGFVAGQEHREKKTNWTLPWAEPYQSSRSHLLFV